MYKYIIFICLIITTSTSGFTFLSQENGLTQMTIRKYSPSSTDSNPFLTDKVVARIKGASTLNNNGISWGVTAVAGTTYYALLSNGINYSLYGIDLSTNQVIINGYSPDGSEMYVQSLVYDSKYEKLIGIAPNSVVPSWFDVVELDQTSGAVKHKLETGKFGDAEYAGIYAFDQTNSKMYIVMKEFDNSTQTTKEGIIPISTEDGKVYDAIWFTGYSSQDTNLYNLAFDPQSQSLFGTTSSYIGTDRSFVKIDPTNGEINVVNNKTEVCAGNGPIIQDGYFISAGHDSVSSNSIYYVSLTTGEIVKKHTDSDLFTLISFLTISDSS